MHQKEAPKAGGSGHARTEAWTTQQGIKKDMQVCISRL